MRRNRLNGLFSMHAGQIRASINAALQNAIIAYEHQYGVGVLAMPIHIALTGGLSCNSYITEAVAAGMEQQYGGSVNVILPKTSG
jgi:hypothetical protein